MKVTINQSKCMHSSEIKGLNLIKLSSEMLQNLNSIFYFLFHFNTMEWTPLLYYIFQDNFIKHKPLISEDYYMSICRFL